MFHGRPWKSGVTGGNTAGTGGSTRSCGFSKGCQDMKELEVNATGGVWKKDEDGEEEGKGQCEADAVGAVVLEGTSAWEGTEYCGNNGAVGTAAEAVLEAVREAARVAGERGGLERMWLTRLSKARRRAERADVRMLLAVVFTPVPTAVWAEDRPEERTAVPRPEEGTGKDTGEDEEGGLGDPFDQGKDDDGDELAVSLIFVNRWR